MKDYIYYDLRDGLKKHMKSKAYHYFFRKKDGIHIFRSTVLVVVFFRSEKHKFVKVYYICGNEPEYFPV